MNSLGDVAGVPPGAPAVNPTSGSAWGSGVLPPGLLRLECRSLQRGTQVLEV